jgi:hypothetical protein
LAGKFEAGKAKFHEVVPVAGRNTSPVLENDVPFQ